MRLWNVLIKEGEEGGTGWGGGGGRGKGLERATCCKLSRLIGQNEKVAHVV